MLGTLHQQQIKSKLPIGSCPNKSFKFRSPEVWVCPDRRLQSDAEPCHSSLFVGQWRQPCRGRRHPPILGFSVPFSDARIRLARALPLPTSAYKTGAAYVLLEASKSLTCLVCHEDRIVCDHWYLLSGRFSDCQWQAWFRLEAVPRELLGWQCLFVSPASTLFTPENVVGPGNFARALVRFSGWPDQGMRPMPGRLYRDDHWWEGVAAVSTLPETQCGLGWVGACEKIWEEFSLDSERSDLVR